MAYEAVSRRSSRERLSLQVSEAIMGVVPSRWLSTQPPSVTTAPAATLPGCSVRNQRTP